MYYHYGSIFWNAGVLSTEALSSDGSGGGIDYSKTAKAIYMMKDHGVTIESPKINFAGADFEINPETNTIYFALSAIPLINDDDVELIKAGRPYKTTVDFFEKCGLPKSKIVMLIKAGCLGNPLKAMSKYAKWISINNLPKNFGITQAKKHIELLPTELKHAVNIQSTIKDKKNFIGTVKSKKVYRLEEDFAYLVDELKYDVDWWQDDDGLCITDKGVEKALATALKSLKEFLSTDEYRVAYAKEEAKIALNSLVKNNFNIKEWEFESTSYYHDSNILNGIDYEKYGFVNWGDMPEEPVFEMRSFRDRTWREYELYALPVTVIGKNPSHNTVFGLTQDDKVVTIKYDAGRFAYYQRKLGESSSFFTRGEKIVVIGYRNGNNFRVKNYKKSRFEHTTRRIVNINENGSIELEVRESES